jgi:hypothetical protein
MAMTRITNVDMAYMLKRKIFTEPRKLKTGKTLGGLPFITSGLAKVLRNRFYLGEVVFKGEILKGSQQPIIDHGLFNSVQLRMDKQRLGPLNAWPASLLA